MNRLKDGVNIFRQVNDFSIMDEVSGIIVSLKTQSL